jgi:hypothetical protein
MSETMEQLASALGCEIVPETLPVKISHERCAVHNFRLISFPRDASSDDLNISAKCPIRGCFSNAIWKDRTSE